MHLNFSLLLSSALLARVSVGVPLEALSSNNNNAALPSTSQLEDGNQVQSPTMRQSTYPGNQSSQSPLLSQMFNTATRNHNNLNDASVNSHGNSNVKYQSGPSLEAEGNEINSDQGELKGLRFNEGTGIDSGMAQVAHNSEDDATKNRVPFSESIGSEGSAPLQQLMNNLGQASPQSVLLDHVQRNSAQAGHALSDSNQFDQVQRIEQTLYQSPQPPQNAETPQAPDEEEPKDSSSGCSSCGCRHCGRRRRFGRRY